MNDFFEPPPPPAPREKPTAMPDWWAAPRNLLPGVVALDLLLAHNERAAVAVTRLAAYPSGFEFELRIITADADDELDPMMFGPHMHHLRRTGVPVPDHLHFGVQFADGSKATNMQPRPGPVDEAPEPPVLATGGGGGGGGGWEQSCWVWPLPPPGPLKFVCEWQTAGIALTTAEIDAQLLIDAAARSRQLFASAGGGGGSSISITSYGSSAGISSD